MDKYVGDPPPARIDLDPHAHAERLRAIRAEYFPKDDWMADAAVWIEWAAGRMKDLEAAAAPKPKPYRRKPDPRSRLDARILKGDPSL